MKTVVPPGSPLGDLLAARPRAYRRSFFYSVWFWLFLFISIGFLINTIHLVIQGAIFYGMIGVTSSQIAYNYHVSEAEVRQLLVSSVKPIPYKVIAYSGAVSLFACIAAVYARKLFRRAQYIVALEQAATQLNPPAVPERDTNEPPGTVQ